MKITSMPLEEGMATHSSILAWGIPWTKEPDGLESIRLKRVRHDWSNSTWTHTYDSLEVVKLEKKTKNKNLPGTKMRHNFMADTRGKVEAVKDFIFLGSKITADGDCSNEIMWHLLLERKAMTNPDSVLKSRDITLPTKIHLIKVMFVSSCHVHMWELDHWTKLSAKELMLLNMVLEKTLETLLDWKQIKPIHPKGNQPWIYIGRIDAEAESPILWLPDAKSWPTGKDPGTGIDWRQKEKEATED